MFKFNAENHSIWLSLIGHVISLALIGLYFDFSTQPIHLGEVNAPIINSYLYSTSTLKTQANVNRVMEQVTQAKKTTATEEKSTLALKKIVQQEQKKSIRQIAPSASGNGKPIPELVALLHEAIQRQQHYPESALEMQREGRVTVVFTLLKNGSIEQLRIIQSSGTTSLDEAALMAVNKAVPFQHIEKLMRASMQEYRIDIVFALT